jgi:hypothetical protein
MDWEWMKMKPDRTVGTKQLADTGSWTGQDFPGFPVGYDSKSGITFRLWKRVNVTDSWKKFGILCIVLDCKGWMDFRYSAWPEWFLMSSGVI